MYWFMNLIRQIHQIIVKNGFTDCSVTDWLWLIDWLTDWMSDWIVDCLADWLADWLTD